jgi:hypothetical protein
MNKELIINDNWNIKYQTSGESPHFFGYHDIRPWNKTNTKLPLLRIPKQITAVQDGKVAAKIVVWCPENDELEFIDTTTAWSWEQAARQQWLPNQDDCIIYNVCSKDGLYAKSHNVLTGKTENYPFTIYSITRDGKYSVSPNFARLWKYWASYGYPGGNAPELDCKIPSNDGIYLMDMESKKNELILSIEEIANFQSKEVVKDVPHFIGLPTFNPSGNQFCFFHRYHSKDGGLFTRFFVANRTGTNLRQIASGTVSHFDWYDDNTILLWTRGLNNKANSVAASILTKAREKNKNNFLLNTLVRLGRNFNKKLKQKILKQHYYLVPIDDIERSKIIGIKSLVEDGHPMFSKDRSFFVTDTYADYDGYQELMIYDMKQNKKESIGRFRLPDNYSKSDLHPRFDHDDKMICVDSAHTGIRQIYILEKR